MVIFLTHILNSCCSNECHFLPSHFPGRLEQAKEAESKDALKDLVNLITSLTTYGVNELKPAGVTTGAPFLLPGFAVPQPAGKGEVSFLKNP